MNAPTCPTCGNALPSRELRGLCPQCLIGQALDPTSPGTNANAAARGSPDPAAAPAARLHYFGDYELIDEIARGGMGVVYRARQVSLNRTVAVKMILAGQFASEADVQRFRVEAEAAANLQHPHIVAIHEIGEHEGRHYFSMDFIDGKNLAEHAQENPLSARETAQLMKQLAEAVHYAHQRGTLHRDLKPQNVLIDAQGQPHITDFGLAKRWDAANPASAAVASELTHTGAVMGSPSYMAPEQATARFGDVGPATDVYSLGAILYQLLTGQPPHRGATALDTLHRVIGDEPAAPRMLRDDVPGDLETICLKCLEKRPERRYATARQLAEEVQRFLQHEPILARPTSVVRKLGSWGLRHPWAITGLGSLVVLGLVVVTYGLWERTEYLQWRTMQAAGASVEARKLLRELLPGWLIPTWGGWTLLTLAVWLDYRLRRRGGGQIGKVKLAACAAIVAGEVLVGLVLLAQIIKLVAWAVVPFALLPMIGIGLLLGLTVSVRFLLQWGLEIRRRWTGEPAHTGLFAIFEEPVARVDNGFDFWRTLRLSAARDLDASMSGVRRRVNGAMFAGFAIVVAAAFFAPRSAQPWWFIGAMLSFLCALGFAGMIIPRSFASDSAAGARLASTRLAAGLIILIALALVCALTQLPPELQRAVQSGIPPGAGVGVLAVGAVAWLGRKKVSPAA